MQKRNFPFAVRLVGFSEAETGAFDAAFSQAASKHFRYARLADSNLRDADLYIVNAGQLRALVTLAHLQPGDARPALLVGTPEVDLPYPRVDAPIRWPVLLAALDSLVEKRFTALSRLQAAAHVVVPERRRRERLDLDLTDPAEYLRMRAPAPRDGMVLVVDRGTVLRDHLDALLARHRVPVILAGNERRAVELCRQQPAAIAMINTATPGVDPYRLCRALKAQEPAAATAVIFVTGKTFVYDEQQALAAGAAGFLAKPLVAHHLVSLVKKFLPMAR